MRMAASLVMFAAAMAWATTWAPASNDAMSGASHLPAHPASGWAIATPATRTRDASRNCSARYAALLDLAELARRDGKSSEVVIRGLSDRRGALSDCLPVNRAEPANP